MIHRMLHGIAEGQNEIINGSALPQESNIDFFNGIDFRKGCYLGQELTIRTHHTGVVRKRILPVQLNKEYAPIPPGAMGPSFVDDPEHPRAMHGDLGLPPPGSNISKVSSRGRSTGKWLGGIGNIGLALCRLEMMTDIRLTDEPTQYDPDQEFKISWNAQTGYEAGEVKVKAFVPQWLRDSITASLKSRARNSPKDQDLDGVD
jgi:folate-binding protein YgfZ